MGPRTGVSIRYAIFADPTLIILTVYLGICTIYTIHAILILRLYGLYGSMRLVYGLCCLVVLTLAAEIYIAVVLVPPFTAMQTVPSIGVMCIPGPGNAFALIWYARHLLPSRYSEP